MNIGDVLEFEAERGFGYIQFLGVHPVYGETILVKPGLSRVHQPPTPELFEDGYVAFYPARAALKEGWVRVVGSLPSRDLPRKLRQPWRRDLRTVSGWIIVEDGHEDLRKTELSESERRLPIATIWMHPKLVRRVQEGWKPEDDLRGPGSTPENAKSEKARESGVGTEERSAVNESPTSKMIQHYIYLASLEKAQALASELRKRGFAIEQRRSADDVTWLVLAGQQTVLSGEAFEAVRDQLESLAEKFDGEYDGWDMEVQ